MITIKQVANEDVYDITVEGNHNFFANGILVHNCVEIGMLPKTKDGISGFQFCLAGSSNILTDVGYRTINSLIETNQTVFNIISPYASDMDSVDKEQYRHVAPAQIFSTGKKQTYRIHLDRGQTIDATGNHTFLTQDGYVSVDELDVDHHKLYAPSYNIDQITTDYDNIANEYDWLGWVIGDGWFTNNPNNKRNVYESLGMVFGSIEDNYAEEALVPVFETLLQEAIGSGVTRTQTHSTNKYVNDAGVVTYMTSSTKARYIAAKFGINAGTAKNKKLPQLYWELSLDNKRRVIGALFSADGSTQCTNNLTKCIRLQMSNPVLAQQVQLALSEFGIVSKYTVSERKHSKRCKTEVVLTITNRTNIERFVRSIGFTLHPRKQKQCQELLSSYTEKQYNRQYNWFTIKSIDDVGVQEVYDITVEDSHNFVVNGVITHNCNLTEINGGKCITKETFIRACTASAILGTIQAGYTNFKYLSDATRQITEQESLIGCSITGWMNNPDVLFDIENMKDGARLIVDINKKIASLLGINQAARTTCAKPSGNASVLLGTASGIHGEHSKKYFRHVQMNVNDEVAKYIQKINPKMVEKSVWSANGTDVVVAFPIETKDGSVYKHELLGVKQLEYVKLAQQYWVEYGTNVELCMHPKLRHNISNTITVDNWDEVEQYLFDNREWFAGVSLLSSYGDKAYVQAPFTEVVMFDEIVRLYGEGALFASGLIVEALRSFGENLWLACDTLNGHGLVLGEQSEDLLKRDWIRRANKFSVNYFNQDIELMTSCLKDCYNLHKWSTIINTIVPIDFAKELGAKTYVAIDTLGSQGCSGGTCELTF